MIDYLWNFVNTSKGSCRSPEKNRKSLDCVGGCGVWGLQSVGVAECGVAECGGCRVWGLQTVGVAEFEGRGVWGSRSVGVVECGGRGV